MNERSSDMLVQKLLPSAPFELTEAGDTLVLATTAMRLEFPRDWQIRAYDGVRLFFSERTDDRAYGPGFEVPPSGYDIAEDNSLSARLSGWPCALANPFTAWEKNSPYSKNGDRNTPFGQPTAAT